MIDYFAALQQLRCAWLDPEELKQKYQELTLTTHPDRQRSQGPAMDFAVVNEAYRILSDPKSRLQHLLSLEGHNPSAEQAIPEELLQSFGKIGTFVQEIDRLLEKLRSADSALAKSLLRSDILNAQQRASELSDQLENLYSNALDELKRLDALWDERPGELIEDFAKLYHRFAYLGRWMDQIRERQFRLSANL
jgi:curved DNA-binding protein CbpA